MLGLTMGDPNGIGPEIIYKYLKNYPDPEITVIGNARALDAFGQINNPLIDPFGELLEVNQGRAAGQNGQASYRYLLKAIELAKTRQIEAIVTAPLNKEALHLGGINFDGHTEILAEQTGIKDFGMMFWSPELNVILTTIHKPLRLVPDLVTKDKFQKTIELGLRGLAELGISRPRIAVCGLNPHAGEGGLFGTEEQQILIPVIKAYQAKQINITGPWPADTLFTPQNRQKYDLVIAHYHDQGLIPLKQIAFDSAVNITVGLPITRTSVDHGTAYDIVGKNSARIDSLRSAIMLARKIVQNKKNV